MEAASAPTAVAQFEAHLFGSFDMRVGGQPLPALRSKRETWLLALLLLRHSRETSREWLASALWPDNAEEQALFYLRKGLSNLRKALGGQADRLRSPTPRTLRFEIEGGILDIAAFDRAVREADWGSAVSIYRGPLLPDCHEEWIQAERTWRETAYHDALVALAESADAAGAVRWLRRLLDADPYRESACRVLMQALADCGDGAAVTAVFREFSDRLNRDLVSEPSEETKALYRKLSRAAPNVATNLTEPAKRPETGRHLPVPLTELIGREEAISELLEWLEKRRLVTLVGAGGVGKTRLGIAVADAALPRFPEGVWFVDLAALTDPSQVSLTVARTLGVAEESGKSATEVLSEAMASRTLLLVLDNCEHLIEACADLAHRLLTSGQGLSIIATSRQALDVVGEQVYRVPSMVMPERGVSTADELLKSEAIRLFVDRARRTNDTFHLTSRNAADVVEICRQLDGIALAIEMAAARLRSLSVSEIRNRLDDRFRLLKSGSRGVLPRQQTLRAAIDWSFDQLSEAERNVLLKVSVFSGGWTVEAAEAVVGGSSSDEAVEDLLAGLVDKSLVVAEVSHDSSRFRLLETVRQYAQFRLLEEEQTEVVRARHRDYFLEFALELRPKLMGADQAHWLSKLDSEHDNFRQAMRFCLETPDGGVPGLRLAGAIVRFWLIRGHYTEGRASVGQLMTHPSAQGRTADRAIALNGTGLLAWRQSDYRGAQALYEESISISRELGSQIDVARALNNLALITRDLGDYDSARTMHEESIGIFRESGDRLITATCLSNLGVVNHYQGDFDSARAAFEEGLAVQRELGDRSAMCVSLNSLGEVALDQGDLELARLCHEEGLSIAGEISDDYGRATHRYGLGRASALRGDLAEGWSMVMESLETMISLGERTLATDHLAVLASLRREFDQPEPAVRLFAARASLRDRTGSPLPEYAQKRMEAELAELRQSLGAEAYDQAWREGGGMSMEAATAYATDLGPIPT